MQLKCTTLPPLSLKPPPLQQNCLVRPNLGVIGTDRGRDLDSEHLSEHPTEDLTEHLISVSGKAIQPLHGGNDAQNFPSTERHSDRHRIQSS